MNIKQNICTLALAAFAAQAANAAIIDEGETVLDTETELRWVKATATRGITAAEAAAEMTPDGAFRDCRWPTIYQVEQLLGNLGLPRDGYCDGYCGTVAPENEAALLAAIALLGDTKDAQLDADGSTLDVASGQAGWLKAQYSNLLTGRFLFLRDGEFVDRATGTPNTDYNDEQYSNREEPGWIGASDAGLLMICPTWPTKPMISEILDFEDVPVGFVAPLNHKDYTVTGDARAYDVGGDVDLRSTVCVYCPTDEPYVTTMTIERTDGKPFAFFNLTNLGDPGNCDDGPNYYSGNNDWRRPCTYRGLTTWGETIYRFPGPSKDFNEFKEGVGPWLSLQSLTVQATYGIGPLFKTYDVEDPRTLLDDVRVGASIPVELDFDPWSSADIINPTTNAFIAIAVATTSVIDGDLVDFDGADIDPDTLRLGIEQAKIGGVPSAQDFDGDGDLDYWFGFRTQETGIRCLDTQLVLSGQTYSGQPFAGAVAVNMHPDCFETINLDLEPGDPLNAVYPENDYEINLDLFVNTIANGDPVDFNPALMYDKYEIRLGPNRAKPARRYTYFNGAYSYAFNMQDTGIVCGDTEVEVVGLYLKTYWNGSSYVYDEPVFPSGKPGFLITAPIQTEECATSSCHP